MSNSNNGSKTASNSHNSNRSSNSNYGTSSGASSSSFSRRLDVRFPINTAWEITLKSQETVQGVVYCTDEISQAVVLLQPLTHTTLATDVRMIHAHSIVKAIRQQQQPTTLPSATTQQGKQQQSQQGLAKAEGNAESAAAASSQGLANLLSAPLPRIQKRALEERERRAIRLAEESLRHINQKASPMGQNIFDRLLKACNEVVWKGESIVVLNQVQVDPPYGPENCCIAEPQRNGNKKTSLEDGSLDRVKKIVAAARSTSTPNTTANS